MWKWNLLCWLIARISRSDKRLVRRLRRLRERVSREIDRFDDSWQTTVSRPKRMPHGVASIIPQQSDVAVIVQGPVVEEDDFTWETLRLYRDTFPASHLILSTWDDTHQQVLDGFRALGVTTITSTAPEVPGPANLNRQIHSTRAGLLAARELGARFALKTRTDMRCYAAHVADYLSGLWQAFPLKLAGRQRGRLIVLDMVTRLFIPNHPSDMLMFGDIEDLLEYWSLPMLGPDPQFSGTKNFGQFLNDPIPEVLLCEHYLQRLGQQPQRTLQSWWQVLADRFLVVDRGSMQLFWKKYNYADEHSMNEDDQNRNLRLCSFCDWINLASADRQPPFEIDVLMESRLNDRLKAA